MLSNAQVSKGGIPCVSFPAEDHWGKEEVEGKVEDEEDKTAQGRCIRKLEVWYWWLKTLIAQQCDRSTFLSSRLDNGVGWVAGWVRAPWAER